MAERKRAHRVCPWWLGYFLATPARRLLQNPKRILKPWVSEGALVIEPGPGMGFFSLELARLVGPGGRVVAVDIQPRMIEALKRRARRAGLADRIDARLAAPEGPGVADFAGKADLVFAMAVVHEIPGPAEFFGDMFRVLKPGGKLLISEPSHHVSAEALGRSIGLAVAAGFQEVARPDIARNRSVVLTRGATAD